MYDYQTTFTLPSNFTGATIAGETAMADNGMVFLNGSHLLLTITGDHGFDSLHAFSDSATSDFKPGLNTLDFIVNNLGGPTGLLVTDISGSYNATPEPGSFILFGSGVFGFAGILRRRLLG